MTVKSAVGIYIIVGLLFEMTELLKLIILYSIYFDLFHFFNQNLNVHGNIYMNSKYMLHLDRQGDVVQKLEADIATT